MTRTIRRALRVALITPVGVAVATAAGDNLIYSFEDEQVDPNDPGDLLQGFVANGAGTTVTRDTIGATNGTKSMKVSVVSGATFVGARTTKFYDKFGDPPGLDHVHFDLTLPQRFDIPNPAPPPERLGFARVGIIVFGVSQPDFPGGQLAVQVQTDPALFEVPLGGLEAGTYRDLRIDLHQLTHPLTFETKSFNEIFGTEGSGMNDIIPTSWQFYFNKSNDLSPAQAFPLTVYIDNVRVGTSVPGDYNGNDVVDAADYVLWRNGGPLRNEVDQPGVVNDGDYTAWRARFGNNMPPGGSGSAVPEPAALLLVFMASCVCSTGVRSHRS